MKLPFPSLKASPPQRGFTVIELLVVIAILGVLAALAAPSFSESIRRYRVNSIRDNLTSSIQLARSEAIRRRTPVALARIEGCGATLGTDNDWDCGWQVFVDVNNNGIFDAANDTVVQVFTIPAGFHLTHSSLTAGKAITVTRFGQPATPATTVSIVKWLVIAPPEGSAGTTTTTVCFFPGGGVRSAKGTPACSTV